MTAKKAPAKRPAKKATAARPGAGANESAVAAELVALNPDQALAQLALTLARTLDEGVGMATAAVARELRATLAEIREGATALNDKQTKADELRARRAARLAAPSNQ
jgi:hypothetical protein